MTTAEINVRTRQAAVGQGGLLSCDILFDTGGGKRHLTFVYDCGSYNRDRLHASIDDLASDVIDVLLLSHLDNDHINGVDVLLDKRQVDTVVIPCLDDLEMTLIVCRSLVTSGAPPGLQEFLKHPTAWFGRRGVKRVIQVRRDSGGDAGPATPRGDDGDPFSIVVEPNTKNENRSPLGYKVRATQPLDVKTLTAGAVSVQVVVAPPAVAIDLQLDAYLPYPRSARRVEWMLLPYVHRFDEGLVDKFRRDVKRIVRLSTDEQPAGPRFAHQLLRALAESKTRKELKLCYAIFETGRNETSLSLYAGPPPGTNNPWEISGDVTRWPFDLLCDARQQAAFRTPPRGNRTDRVPGWLCTGDANLAAVWTRTPWLSRYSTLFEQVGVFVLPHHGSDGSLSDDVLDAVGEATYLACAKRASEVHPHKNVIARLGSRGQGLWQVSEDEQSTFLTTAIARI